MQLIVDRPRVDVQVATLERVEAILREAPAPVSRYYIHKKLSEAGSGTTPARLNRALGYLEQHAMIVEGSKGVQWTQSNSPDLANARATGRRL